MGVIRNGLIGAAMAFLGAACTNTKPADQKAADKANYEASMTSLDKVEKASIEMEKAARELDRTATKANAEMDGMIKELLKKDAPSPK